MIYSYTITPQALTVDGNIVFTVDEIKTGCTVTHAAGTPTFTFNKPGYYFVTFNGVASATAAATDPIVAEMYNGATAIPGALSSALSAAIDTTVALSISTVGRLREQEKNTEGKVDYSALATKVLVVEKKKYLLALIVAFVAGVALGALLVSYTIFAHFASPF